jgi:DNA-binding NarL/FixJ family response regulator
MQKLTAKLKAKWDKKLKDSGFVDIENADGTLKNEVDPRTIASALGDNRAEYYRQATDYHLSHAFDTLTEECVWSLHCEGKSFRQIANHLDLTFYNVRTIINFHQKLAGLKK